MLRVKAEEDVQLDAWLKKKTNKYTSHEIQNEVLKIMCLRVLREICTFLHSSPFITIMMDETMDISNREQATLVFRMVTDDFDVQYRAKKTASRVE